MVGEGCTLIYCTPVKGTPALRRKKRHKSVVFSFKKNKFSKKADFPEPQEED
eukprot:UN09015